MMGPNNILDANIDAPEAEQLRRKLKAKKIGLRFLPAQASDEQIIGLLRRLKTPTFITQDCKDFYAPDRCDKKYCIICLDVPDELVAITVRKIYRDRYAIIQLNRRILIEAIQLFYRHPLRAYDAIQLATAIESNQTLIANFNVT